MKNHTRFQRLFGINPEDIHKNCILLPFLPKNALDILKVNRLHRGLLYATGSHRDFTLVRTGMGSSLLGDAVLELEHTPCRNLFLFGSAGLVQLGERLSLGSLVVPNSSYALESFSQLLSNTIPQIQPSGPDPELLRIFQEHCQGTPLRCQSPLPQGICASMGSLVLEKDYKNYFTAQGIQLMDMESAAFYSAAKHIRCKALALFYITDILNDKPPFFLPTPKERLCIEQGVHKGLNLLVAFAKKLSSDKRI